MFGRRTMYKKGLSDAMQAYEAFSEKQKAALTHMREEVRSGNKRLEAALCDLGEDLNGIYNHLSSLEKATLYRLSTPVDIKDLDENDKKLLLAILYQLAYDEGKSITDAQRKYLRSVQKYLEITNPQTVIDLSAVENIDSLDVQKAFLQVALEFFYLQDSYELTNSQEEFLGYFSVNKKQAAIVEESVSRLYNAVGAEGLAEKYGFVPNMESALVAVEKETELQTHINKFTHSLGNVSEDLADQIVKMGLRDSIVESENYILLSDSVSKFYRIDKRTHEWTIIGEAKNGTNFPRLDAVHWGNDSFKKVLTFGDIVYYRHSEQSVNGIYAFNIDTLQRPERILTGNYKNACICENCLLTTSNDSLSKYDMNTKEVQQLLTGFFGAVFATHEGVYFSRVANDAEHPEIGFYRYSDQTTSTICIAPHAISDILNVQNNTLLVRTTKLFDWDVYGTLILNGNININQPSLEQIIDVLNGGQKYVERQSVQSYQDKLIYVAADKSLKVFDYASSSTATLAPNAINRNSAKKDMPAMFYRLGDWIYFETYDSSTADLYARYQNSWRAKLCRISLASPNKIDIVETYDKNTRAQFENGIRLVTIGI